MALLDVNGNPIPSSVIEQIKENKPSMGADVYGLRPAITEQTGFSGFTPDYVAMLLSNSAQGDSQAWQVFAHLLEQKDLHYLSVLTKRKMQVAQLPFTVEDAGSSSLQKKQGDFIRAWLDKGILEGSAFDILDGIAKGYSVHEIFWHCEAGNYYPKTLKYRPQRWFEIDPNDGETIFLRDIQAEQVKTPDIPDAVPQLMRSPLNHQKAFVHKHPSWSGLLLDAGLTRAVALNCLYKLFTNKDWAIFTQAFGMPMRVGKYGQSATEDDKDKLWMALTDLAGTMSCMIPASMQLEFIEAKRGAAGDAVFENRCKWLDEQTSKAVLGQTGTTDARQGTHAAALTHRMVEEDIERRDARLLSYSVNTQLVRMMIDFSFGAPKDGNYPLIHIGRPDEVPVDTLIDAIQKAGPQGFKVKANDLYARLNLDPPKEGDVVVGLTAQAQPITPAQDRPPEDKPATVKAAKEKIPTNKDLSPVADAEGLQTLHSGASKVYPVNNPNSPQGNVVRLSAALAGACDPAMDDVLNSLKKIVGSQSSLENLKAVLENTHLLDNQTEYFREAIQEGMSASLLAGMSSVLSEGEEA